ncbi:MAG: DUF4426 domain-containing protein [Gammaproteobacteria bacterium]
MLTWFGVPVLAALLCGPALADSSQDFGNYVVHFNALTTDMLSPTVAKQYGITRSGNRGMINVVVLKKVMGTPGQPVKAELRAMGTNLTGQIKDITLREIHEGNAIYYLGQFSVAHEETVNFDITVHPAGSDDTYHVRFRHQFFGP